MKNRIDILLRQWGLAPSRSKAQELIREGAVEVRQSNGWRVCEDESLLMSEDDKENVRLKESQVLEYVSRGGRKLEAALERLGLDVRDFTVLDVGISTGGFSDCLLRRGVKEIVGIDVGRGQLHDRLKNESRLKAFEGINARTLRRESRLAPWMEKGGFDLAVVDVSFISLELLLPEVCAVLRSQGRLLALIKPQFEVSSGDHNRRGIVTDLELHAQVREKIAQSARRCGLEVLENFKCALTGQDGNQEYFIYARKNS